MEFIFLSIVTTVIFFAILYHVIKAAVRNGILEAKQVENGTIYTSQIDQATCQHCGKEYDMDYPKCPHC